jgi:glycosyltransferase involved in cell wall biosynthesis
MFAPQPATALRKQLGLEGKFAVSYIGTIGMAHGLDTIISAAAQLQDKNPRISFLVVGEGAEKDRITALAQTCGLTNLQFVAQQPREQIPSYIGASDACLVLLKNTELFKTVIPTKMLEFMSCARPVILGVDGQARSILEEARGGIAIEPENSDALMNAIRQLERDRETSREFGRNGREYILRKYSRGHTAEKYIKVLEELLQLPKPQATEAAA